MARPENTFVAGNDVLAAEHNENWTEVWGEIDTIEAEAAALAKKVPFFGDGAEGDVDISSSTDLNPTLTNVDASSASGQKVVNVAATTGLSAGDHVFIHQTQGSTMGLWEIGKIASVQSGVSITLEDDLKNTYAATGAQVLKIPEYGQLRFKSGASLNNPAWNGSYGGICVVYAKNGIIIDSGVTVSMASKGLRGGSSITSAGAQNGKAGEGSGSNYNVQQYTRNGTGGGGAGPAASNYLDAPGGGNLVAGGNGEGGSSEGGYSVFTAFTTHYANVQTPKIFIGSGGGSGGYNSADTPLSTGRGGNGGGIIIFITPFIHNYGTVSVNGENGQNGTGYAGGLYGGGGAGGAVVFITRNVYNASAPTFAGGTSTGGGAGGAGMYFAGMIEGIPSI